MPKIALKNLSKVYSSRSIFGQESKKISESIAQAVDKVALSEVDIIIDSGDRIGIVGRNGAGKSTLLQIIAGLSLPTSGDMEVVGNVTSVMTLGVGLRDDLSGRENIFIDGEIQGKSEQEIKGVIDQIIDFAELGEFIDYPVRTYSTGMKARLAFSMISYIDPEILILDEALSVGDAAFSIKATARIREICSKGKIVIIVSHSMQAIRDICNRCLWMENGRVIMDGAPEIITRSYIDSVHATDEDEIRKRFHKLAGSHSKKEGWEVGRVDIFNGDGGESRKLLEAGLPTHLNIQGIAPQGEKNVCLRIQILRLDDLILFDESLPLQDFRLDDQSFGLKVEMSKLVLGVAVYRLVVILGSLDNVFAKNTSFFEVFSTKLPRGGRPMLLYPINIKVSPVSSYKEVT